jgi:hypothetical protein
MACYDSGDYDCTYDSGDLGAGCGGSGCDYTSVGTWEGDTDIDISGYGILNLECYDSQNHNDGAVSIAGATNLDSTHYRKIISSPSCSTTWAGADGTGANFVYTGGGVFLLEINEKWCRLEQLALRYNGSRAATVYTVNVATEDNFVIAHCVVFNPKNNEGANICKGIQTFTDTSLGLVYGCIVYGGDDDGFALGGGFGDTNAILCSTAIGNAGYGINNTTGGDPTMIAWSCYAADNTTADFDEASWDAPSDYNASKDNTSDLNGTSTNFNNATDHTGSMDGDYLLTAAINDGQNPYNDVTATSDFNDFLRNDTAGDALFKYDVTSANERNDESTADSEWDVGASEYIAAGGLSIPVAMHHYLRH